MNKSSKIAFAIGVIVVVFEIYTKIFFPIIAFAPFLILLAYTKPLSFLLWAATFCGTIIDCFSSTPFGLYAINYTFVCFFLYLQRKYFYEDNPFIFTILCSVFSLCSTIIHLIFLSALDLSISLNPFSILTDLVLCSLLDGLFGLILIYIPLYFFEKFSQLSFPFWKKRRSYN